VAYATLAENKDHEQIEEIDFILETAMLPPLEQAARKNARAMRKWQPPQAALPPGRLPPKGIR
jgi:hypothetical protein